MATMVENETSDTLAWDPAISHARQMMYRLSALALADPRHGTWHALAALSDDPLLPRAAAVLRDEPAASPLALGEQPAALLDPARVLARLPASPEALNALYESTFGLLSSGICPPHESDYINEKFTFQRSHSLADVSGFYRAFGLDPAPHRPEQYDHIALELEFMAFLLGLERRAADSSGAGKEEKNAEQMIVCRDAARQFLRDHLVWWAPAFGRLLAHENPGGYYEAVGHFLGAFIAVERALCGIEPPRMGAFPSTIERPEACEGCGLNPEA